MTQDSATQAGPEAARAPSRREGQVQARRRALLEAAVTVIARQGLTGVTVNSIAAEAGCSFGAVAFHFQSKEGIVFAALDHSAAEYEAHLGELRKGATGPADRLRCMLETDFGPLGGGAASIALWLSFWAECVRVPAYRERLAVLRDRFNLLVQEDLEALAEARGRALDAELAAISLNAMISGLWIDNTVSGDAVETARTRGREACLTFLRLHFPEDF